MSNEIPKEPFIGLGRRLKYLRQDRQETVAEVSGAVEIDAEMLLSIERGSKLPSEDILLLLISHFDLKNEEAMNLWKLAGYDELEPTRINSDNITTQASIILMALDSRVVYTDLVHVTTSNYGIVMNFMQASSQKNGQHLSIAKVGMSREHAANVLKTLQKALEGSGPKLLNPATDTKTDKKEPKD
jgi:transcriptional regulator with XRE-family HTH domain